MAEKKIPGIQKCIAVLWPSFLVAVVATGAFFSAFDPRDLYPFDNDIDVSPQLIAFFGSPTPPQGSWRFVSCPTTAPIVYTFDGREWSNTWFFRVWIRNARLPVSKVEYQLAGGAWRTVGVQSDGAYQASSQDFSSGFSLRVTAVDGQTVVDAIPGLGGFAPDKGVTSQGNFQ